MLIDETTLKAAEQLGRWLFAGDKLEHEIDEHVRYVCEVHGTNNVGPVRQLGEWLGEILRKRNDATMKELKRAGIHP